MDSNGNSNTVVMLRDNNTATINMMMQHTWMMLMAVMAIRRADTMLTETETETETTTRTTDNGQWTMNNDNEYDARAPPPAYITTTTLPPVSVGVVLPQR